MDDTIHEPASVVEDMGPFLAIIEKHQPTAHHAITQARDAGASWPDIVTNLIQLPLPAFQAWAENKGRRTGPVRPGILSRP